MNLLKKILNISLKKTMSVSLVLGTVAVLLTRLIQTTFDLYIFDILTLILLIFLPVVGGTIVLVIIFKSFAQVILYLIGLNNENSDFFKSKEIERKEVVQKATQEKAKDLEEDLFS